MNPDTRSISVEWLEKGETKGKEVRLTTVSITNTNKFIIIIIFFIHY